LSTLITPCVCAVVAERTPIQVSKWPTPTMEPLLFTIAGHHQRGPATERQRLSLELRKAKSNGPERMANTKPNLGGVLGGGIHGSNPAWLFLDSPPSDNCNKALMLHVTNCTGAILWKRCGSVL
ncbi:hypothetical protein CT0861_00924, partial [Colletotrichum tofieldiae]